MKKRGGMMGIFGKRLRLLRERNNMSQRELAEKLGLSTMAISNYELGKREPDVDTIMKLARIFNVSVAYLLGEVDDPKKQPGEVKLIIHDEKVVKYVPVFSTSISAGNGIFPDSFYPLEYVPITRKDVDYVFNVEGDSMEPEIKNGGRILVKATTDINEGDMIVCLFHGMIYVKYYHKLDDDKIMLTSENKEYPPMVIDREEFIIIGKVVEINNPPKSEKFRKR
ncbi:MAG TPA: LexA family transcriptional regulator [Thermotogales bacterium]|nr:LexA family transcriptional regulator [Thermotogales bacterium]